MTKDEFRVWFSAHCLAFTGLGEWFRGLPRDSSGMSQATQSGLLGAWYRVLQDVALSDATEATALLFRESEQIYFDRHPSTIRRLASQVAADRQRVEGIRRWPNTSQGETYRCLDCQDDGLLTIWDKRAYAAVRSGTFELKTCRTLVCTAACRCARGDRHEGSHGNLRRFNPAVHVIFNLTDLPGSEQALRSQVELHRQQGIERQSVDHWEPANGDTYDQYRRDEGAAAVSLFNDEEGNGHEGF